jgi:hypothetical protein
MAWVVAVSNMVLPTGRAKKWKLNHYRIEGENVTCADIATRLNLRESQVHSRMRKLRTQPGAITWDKLKGKK